MFIEHNVPTEEQFCNSFRQTLLQFGELKPRLMPAYYSMAHANKLHWQDTGDPLMRTFIAEEKYLLFRLSFEHVFDLSLFDFRTDYPQKLVALREALQMHFPAPATYVKIESQGERRGWQQWYWCGAKGVVDLRKSGQGS
jgi:hypothetical protein